MRKLFLLLLCVHILNGISQAQLKGELSDNQIIASEVLGYDLQYRVYTPPSDNQRGKMPVIYLTDGQWYISEGEMPQIIDELIVEGKIDPIIAVFVDNRDPHNLRDNRRNRQFLGNEKYVEFYRKELVKKIEDDYPVSAKQEDRAIMGLSFGGLNATVFGAKASDTFHMLGIQSPALHPVSNIYSLYEDQPKLPLKIFLSTGSSNDTEVHARKLKKTLEGKGYDFEYVEVDEGHNWRNWKPLLDDTLLYFFGK